MKKTALGALLIRGTHAAPVVITSARAGGYWGGIMAEGASALLRASVTLITFSGANFGNRAGHSYIGHNFRP